jgi:hypothetical protein
MKRFIILAMTLLIITGVVAQQAGNSKELKKEASQKKKDEKNAKIDSAYRMMDMILSSKRFVLEAHRLSNNRGAQVFVTPNLNFISLDSLHAIIQVGSNAGVGGNGVGGITVDGKLTNWRYSKNDKKKNFDVFMTVQSNIGVYDVTMAIDYSGIADASITGIRSGDITFTGNILPRGNSSIFKGMSH